ncbi:site-2 protease family protein [Dactylosporangium sp. NPDC050688]|uniref:site-2 protease family protein n=1 Tax=Dactylosporangium sp. NPDC050688 TaxID=3157217 RepID=UPI0033CFC022
MRQSLRLGVIAGIPVGVHWSVLVVAILIWQMLALAVVPAGAPGRWLLAAAGAVVFLASLLAHELAHALVGRLYGVRADRVTLWVFGGVTEFRTAAPHPRADLFTAVAGPAASALCGAVAAGIALPLGGGSGWLGGVAATLRWLAAINLLLAVFNLLPGAPLDGGRVLRAVLWWWRGDRGRADVTAARVGRVLGAGLIALGVAQLLVAGDPGGIWLALIGWLLSAAAVAEANAGRYRAALGELPVRAVMRPEVVCADPGWTVADAEAALTSPSAGGVVAVRARDGRPAAVVRSGDLDRIPPAQRAELPVSRLADAVPVVEAAQPLADVAGPVSRAGTALVVQDGRLVGVLERAAVVEAVRRGPAETPSRPAETPSRPADTPGRPPLSG